MIKHIAAFIFGAAEFRSDFTMHHKDYRLAASYDKGREFMHRITFRRFEY